MEIDELLDRVVDNVAAWRPHTFVGGRPPQRLYRMQIQHEVRARRLGVRWEPVDLRLVYQRDKGICGICREPVSLELFTIDHIMALSRGGAHVMDNLQIAHRVCNSRKGRR